MPDFDPKSNGHRSGKEPLQAPADPRERRGSGILLVTLVSALTGLNLMLGAGLGSVVSALVSGGDVLPVVAVLGAALGGALGVAYGVKVGLHYGGSAGFASRRLLTAFGLAGLIGSIALAAAVASPLVPIVAILLPGMATVAGDRYATRRHLAATGQLKPRRKLRDQEASD